MRKVAGQVIGISITDEFIHAVVVEAKPNTETQVVKTASALVPDGSFPTDHIPDAAILGGVIRQMLNENGITARTAVIGLPSRAVTTRSINIPPVPPKERRLVVRGEIEHMKALPQGRGAYDFIALRKMEGAASNPKGDPLLFFAAEDYMVDAYRAMAAAAGLTLLGLEPFEFAAIRAIYPALKRQPLALALSLGTHQTDAVFFKEGEPVYARRLDTGIHQMVVPEVMPSPTGQQGGWQMFEMSEMSELGAGSAGILEVGESTASAQRDPQAESIASTLFGERLGKAGAARETLALEIGRSIDYFRREYRGEIDSMQIVLLPNNLDLAGLPVYMTTALEQDVQFAYAFEHIRHAPGISERFLEEEGVAYAPALGLALGATASPKFVDAPGFDLSIEEAEVVRARRAPVLLKRSLLASAAVLAVAGVSAFVVDQIHRPIEAELTTAKKERAELSGAEALLLAEQEQHQNLVHQIRSQNVPWTSVLYNLGHDIIPGVGVNSISLQGDGLLSLSGSALNQDRVSDFWLSLNRGGFFKSVSTSNISSGTDGRATFQMTLTLPPQQPPPPAPKSLKALVDMDPLGQ